MPIYYYRGIEIGTGASDNVLWEIDISDELDIGETISAVSVPAVTGFNATLESNTGTLVYLRTSGGTKGEIYDVYLVVDTDGSNSMDLLIRFEIPNP